MDGPCLQKNGDEECVPVMNCNFETTNEDALFLYFSNRDYHFVFKKLCRSAYYAVLI